MKFIVFNPKDANVQGGDNVTLSNLHDLGRQASQVTRFALPTNYKSLQKLQFTYNWPIGFRGMLFAVKRDTR